MSKRSADSSATGVPPAKRATLNSFFPTTSTPKLPSPIVSSSPITDRQSTFIAHAVPITHESQATLFQSHVRSSRGSSHPVECDHEILAWRTMSLKVGKNGLGGEDDWTVKTGGDDDGEKGGSREVHNAIQSQAAVDVAVVVSRLYGGVMLGPARFQHMNRVATQALERLAHAQSIPPLIERLNSLDEEISQLAPPVDSKATTPKKGGAAYDGMTVDKLERLCLAREKKLSLLKKKHREEEEALWKEVEKGSGEVRSGDRDPTEGDGETEVDKGSRASDEEVEEVEEVDEEEEALWAALEAQAQDDPPPTFDGPTAAELGLPDEEEAAVAAATLRVQRKQREREAQVEPRTSQPSGGGFVAEET
ncbi:hypothetical protein JCM3766R1_005077 [Sporobolomyces carnicolor]